MSLRHRHNEIQTCSVAKKRRKQDNKTWKIEDANAYNAMSDLLLPTSKHLLTSLITTIATSTSTENDATSEPSNPLSNATDSNTKFAILTLHTLFPNDLLPALDLLDRGLVTRLVLSSPDPTPAEQDLGASTADTGNNHYSTTRHKKILSYQVRTAQPHHTSSRSRPSAAATADPTHQPSYTVHLHAWTCTCPAFTFAAFPAPPPSSHPAPSEPSPTRRPTATTDSDARESFGWLFGGLAREDDPPVCKHLLACVLAERGGGGFEAMVGEREGRGEDVAGWAAGWGD